MSFKAVSELEKRLGEFFGAPYVVCLDACTHGIELCLRYQKLSYISVPRRTYVSVPFLANKLNISLTKTNILSQAQFTKVILGYTKTIRNLQVSAQLQLNYKLILIIIFLFLLDGSMARLLLLAFCILFIDLTLSFYFNFSEHFQLLNSVFS